MLGDSAIASIDMSRPCGSRNVGGRRTGRRRIGHVAGVDLVERGEVLDGGVEDRRFDEVAMDVPAFGGDREGARATLTAC